MRYEYAILMFRPSRFMRPDAVAAGIVVKKRNQLDIRIPWQTKLSAIMPSMTPRMVHEAEASLRQMAERAPEETWAMLPEMPHFSVDTSAPGWFEVNAPDEYEQRVNEILDTQVRAPRKKSERDGVTRLQTDIRAWFKKNDMLGRRAEDMDKRKVVPRVPIRDNQDMRVDFAWKNGAINFAVTSDLRADSLSAMEMKSRAALASILMLEGKRAWHGKGHAVYAADAANERKAQASIMLLDSYCDGRIYNFLSADDMARFYSAIAEDIGRPTIAESSA